MGMGDRDFVSALNALETISGTLASLTTTDKTTLVAAINELVTSVAAKFASASAGSLAALTTTDKTTLVAAINELVTSLATKLAANNNIDMADNFITNTADPIDANGVGDRGYNDTRYLQLANAFVARDVACTGAPQVVAHGKSYVPVPLVVGTNGNNGAGGAGTQATNISAVSADAINVTFTGTAGGQATVLAV